MPGPRLNAAYYAAPVAEFLRAAESEIYAPLASPHGYTLAPEQLSAWRRQYLKNAYRVLLTRARQGMVIFVPTGQYLTDLGVPQV